MTPKQLQTDVTLKIRHILYENITTLPMDLIDIIMMYIYNLMECETCKCLIEIHQAIKCQFCYKLICTNCMVYIDSIHNINVCEQCYAHTCIRCNCEINVFNYTCYLCGKLKCDQRIYRECNSCYMYGLRDLT